MTDEERQEILSDLATVPGGIPDFIKDEILSLADRLADILPEYSPTSCLFVLEAALVSSVNAVNPILADLFHEMMKEYKRKANIFLQITDALAAEGITTVPPKGDGTPESGL